MTQSPDPSLAALAVLRDQQSSVHDRQADFERLLELESGWWGKGPLVLFAQACALAMSRHILLRHALPADAVDWESAGDEALMALAAGGEEIRDPRAWLMGTIRNQLRRQVREGWPELRSSRADDLPDAHHPLSSIDPPPEDPATERQRQILYDAILEAIQALAPALRVVAQLTLIERQSPREIAETLGIPPATVRKRLQRMRTILQKELAARIGDAK